MRTINKEIVMRTIHNAIKNAVLTHKVTYIQAYNVYYSVNQLTVEVVNSGFVDRKKYEGYQDIYQSVRESVLELQEEGYLVSNFKSLNHYYRDNYNNKEEMFCLTREGRNYLNYIK